uniref:AlNc14C512G11999 protein n=1 Tax=Albugo laibachii Nc14 TaxID=890382 RepID=F0X0Q4_9STRA|nr:AlNc14C512G11999 [Albugo laibachii Nc14]|eukprot:CCA27348.1 AlNc14C512G11999 [Albugo laibachii Nc14]
MGMTFKEFPQLSTHLLHMNDLPVVKSLLKFRDHFDAILRSSTNDAERRVALSIPKTTQFCPADIVATMAMFTTTSPVPRDTSTTNPESVIKEQKWYTLTQQANPSRKYPYLLGTLISENDEYPSDYLIQEAKESNSEEVFTHKFVKKIRDGKLFRRGTHFKKKISSSLADYRKIALNHKRESKEVEGGPQMSNLEADISQADENIPSNFSLF